MDESTRNPTDALVELKEEWRQRAYKALKAMDDESLSPFEKVHADQVWLTYMVCVRTMPSVADWRVNASNAKAQIRPGQGTANVRWEAMVEINTRCADEYEALRRVGCWSDVDDEQASGRMERTSGQPSVMRYYEFEEDAKPHTDRVHVTMSRRRAAELAKHILDSLAAPTHRVIFALHGKVKSED